MQNNSDFSHSIDSGNSAGNDGAQKTCAPHGRAASMLFRYILFGVLTTAVNVCVFSLLRAARVPLTVSVAAAWGISVAFAFVTNRSFVFRPDADAPVQHNDAEKAEPRRAVLREAALFLAARVFSGAVDVVLMAAFSGRAALGTDTQAGETVLKLLANVIVVILNFILSKAIVFKRRCAGV